MTARSSLVMSPLGKHAKQLVLFFLMIGLAARLCLVLRPIDVLTNRYLADDFFYYLNIAFNTAHGRGSTFDGGISYTNGYNPLPMWLLALAFRLGASKTAAIHIGLIIQAVSVVGMGWLAATYCARRQAPVAAILVAALVSFGPFFIWPTVNGFETGLAAATAFVALELWDSGAAGLWVGVACGVAFLTRVDAMAVIFVLMLACGLRRQWPAVARIGSGFLLVTLPYFVWSMSRFGLILPGSAVQKVRVRDLASIRNSIGIVASTLPEVLLPHRILERTSPSVAWTLAAVTTAICLIGASRLGLVRGLLLVGIIGAYSLVADGFEPGALKRYLFFAWVLLLMSAALGLDRIGHRLRQCMRGNKMGMAITTTVVLGVILSQLADCVRFLWWDRATAPVPSYVGVCRDLAPDLGTFIYRDDRVSSFDSGSLGYFASLPVVNLDGLVNQDIAQVKRGCDHERYETCLRRYLREKGITVLVGGTAFGWTTIFPDWPTWPRLYQSRSLSDGSRVVVLRIPEAS
jgi:hypothetical protein